MRMLMLACLFTMIIMGGGCGKEFMLEYPVSERGDHVDEYHGEKIADPYRWLEEDVRESQEVRDWVTAQNEVTFGYLEQLSQRDKLKERLTALWDYEKYGTPFKRGGRYYISKNDGLQNHAVIYRMDSLEGERQVLFNPNEWSEDGTVALGGMAFSKDGKYVAYGIQEAGSDWRTWKVRDIASGEDLSDTLEYLKFTGVAWAPDSSGLYFAKYPDPDPNDQFQALNKKMRIMFHRLGTDQSEDQEIFYDADHPEWGYGVGVTDDGRYLVATVWVGTDNRYRVKVQDLQAETPTWIDLVDEFKYDYSFIDNVDSTLYFFTDDQAPKGRIVAIDLDELDQKNWQEIVPERDEPLQGVNIVNNTLVCSYLKDVVTQITIYDLQGKHVRDVPLPGIGTASGFGGKRHDTETFYRFESYAMPPSIYRYDMATGESTLFERSKVDIDPEDYVTEQVFYKSKDGTRVPMFITHKKGIAYDGSNPTLLYGYGGFNITLEPYFSLKAMTWVEMGGIYAVANLRGGGEYGKAWHEAGKKLNKQNVFDDFIAAAEHLIDMKITQPKKLAIHGGSNGGLLVGACMAQRPELFGAAVPAVGVMDMLRFDAFTAGRFWTDDYGSAQDNKEMFDYLKGYSPYHNLKPGTDYPATLVVTADTDDRVVPGHSFKFSAELQRCHAGTDPVLIRIETRAGHGSGKPTHMIIEEIADIYAFLAENLGME